MKQTVEAIIDEQGHVRLAEPVKIIGMHRALVTILDEAPLEFDEVTQLAETALSEDWLKPEEDAAWTHLQ
jgi:hypothetical protein